MRTFRSFAATLGLLLAALSTSCSPPGRTGHLIIAGGATSPDNELIYSRFIAPLPPDAVIGIIPAASANPPESAAASAKTIARYAGSRRIEQFNISLQNPTAASDPETVRRLRGCSALWFTGGVQSRITQVFRPPSGDTPAYKAASDVLAKGGVIGGTSAGAAMMSDPMITGGSSEDALSGAVREAGEDAGFGMAQGMGFFPYGLTDQHFLRRGRLGRLVVALEKSKVAHGYGVEEDSAIDADLASGIITALGPVLFVDASNLRREGGSILGVRVSLINSGDTVDAPTGRVLTPLRKESLSKSVGDPEPLPAAWSRGAVTVAIERLATTGQPSVTLRSDGWELTLSRSPETVVWTGSGRISVHAVDLKLVPAPRAPPKTGS